MTYAASARIHLPRSFNRLHPFDTEQRKAANVEHHGHGCPGDVGISPGLALIGPAGSQPSPFVAQGRSRLC